MPMKSVVRLTDRPDMTIGVDCGHKTRTQKQLLLSKGVDICFFFMFSKTIIMIIIIDHDFDIVRVRRLSMKKGIHRRI